MFNRPERFITQKAILVKKTHQTSRRFSGYELCIVLINHEANYSVILKGCPYCVVEFDMINRLSEVKRFNNELIACNGAIGISIFWLSRPQTILILTLNSQLINKLLQ